MNTRRTARISNALTRPLRIAARTAPSLRSGGDQAECVVMVMKPIPKYVRRVADANLSYWVLNYPSAPFHRPGLTFRDYGPALYLGMMTFEEHPERFFDDPRSDLRGRYEALKGNSPLAWPEARRVAWAAWERAHAQALACQTGPIESLRLCAHA